MTIDVESLVRDYEKRLLAIARSLVQKDEEARDIVQLTFLKAHLKRDTLVFPAQAAFPWLRKVTVNFSIDCLRRRQASPIVEYDDRRSQEAPEAEFYRSSADQLENKELRDRLQVAFSLIPEVQRTAFLRFAEDGEMHKDIAEQVGVPMNTITTRVNRAKKRLQLYLSADRSGT